MNINYKDQLEQKKKIQIQHYQQLLISKYQYKKALKDIIKQQCYDTMEIKQQYLYNIKKSTTTTTFLTNFTIEKKKKKKRSIYM